MLDFFSGLANAEIYIALVLAAIFTGAYAGLFRWRKTAAGRAIFYLFLSWIAITVISILTLWFGPEYEFRPIWRAVGWSFVVFALGNLLFVLGRSFLHKEHPLANVEPRHTEEIPVVKEDDDG